jgi:hypothetical protein
LQKLSSMKFFGALLVPVVAASDPFPASAGDGSWQWVDVEGTQCMGGEQTGVYVRYSQSGNTNLGVYLYGGGACFNELTCGVAATTNPHPGDMGSKGIFEPRSDNPLNDYNWITVPYCTGDVHAGQNEKRIGLKKREFSGSENIKLIMEKAVSTFTEVGTVFVTGESAGGFGALAAYTNIRDNYPDARGVLMDDSGQVLADDYLAACLVEEWRDVWNINANLPADCPCNNDEGNLASWWAYARQKYPQDSFSLISSVNDGVISAFFGFGQKNCSAVLPVGFNKMNEGLEALAATGVNIYMIPGAGHTHTSFDEFYTRVVDGVGMYQWIGQLIDANQEDPATVRPTSEDIMNEAMAPAPTNAHPINRMIV